MKHLFLVFFSTYLSISNVFGVTTTTTSNRGLRNYPNYYFIETGTQTGDGIQEAMESGVFNKYSSIEIEDFYVEDAQRRFRNNPNVSIYLGDSAVDLSNLLQNINLPTTFWLDAYFNLLNYAQYMYDNGFSSEIEPLLQELDQIKDHSIKTHTIMIGDITWILDEYSSVLNLTDIENAIYDINSNYVIEYADAFGKTDNVLVAYIP